MGARSTYTQGGIHKYGLESLDAQNTDSKFGHPEFTTLFEKHLHSNREGFYGWQGYGGKVFQWHPQLNIGFAYVSADMFILDFCNHKASKLQREVV